MKPETKHIDALKQEAFALIDGMESVVQLEMLIGQIQEMKASEVLGYRPDGTAITQQDTIERAKRSLEEYENGKAMTLEETKIWFDTHIANDRAS
ncbi:MAG: hypothetical protein AAF570_15435 [Bacteroidota bacterium]